MKTTTVTLEIQDEVLEQVFSYLNTLNGNVRLVEKELSHEELSAAPEEDRINYYQNNGGVLLVAKENNSGFSDDTTEALLALKEARRNRNTSAIAN